MYDRRRVRCVRRPSGKVYIPTGWTPPERRSRFHRHDEPDRGTDLRREAYIGASRRAPAARAASDRSAASAGERFRKHTRQSTSVTSEKTDVKQNGHTRFNLRRSSRSQAAAPVSDVNEKQSAARAADTDRRYSAPPPPPPYDEAAYPYYPPAIPVFYPAYPQPRSVYDQFHSMLTDEELAELAEAEDYEDRYGCDFDRYAD